MYCPAGEFPDQPGIYGTDADVVARFALAVVIEQPPGLACREQRIKWQPGLADDDILVTCIAQCIARWRGAPALPSDHRSERLAGRSAPSEHRLPLVRNSDGGDFADGSGLQTGRDGRNRA